MKRSGSITGTGNFFRHMKEKHAERVQEIYDYTASKSSSNLNKPRFVQTKLNQAISNEKVSGISKMYTYSCVIPTNFTTISVT